MKKITGLLLALVLVLTLAACGNSGTGLKIGVVLPDASEERWANQDGAFFAEELEALGEGYDYQILYSQGSEEKEVQNVEALIALGAEVIILTSQGSGGGAAQVVADEAGVTLIAHDRMAMKDDDVKADYYTTFNSWNVGKAQGQHLVDMATDNGCSSSAKCDLAIFSGRTADWPNATYFFGGAMEVLVPAMDMFNIINQEDNFSTLAVPTETDFDKTALQAAMSLVDTDWNAATALTKAEGLVSAMTKTSDDVYVLAPNDDTSASIRIAFADMSTPYTNYYTTGQDASNVTLASLMGDEVNGKGTQTMTVFKDVKKLVADSVAIAKNIVDGVDGLEGLTGGPEINGVKTAYSPIDILLASDPQKTYDLIFATGYKDVEDEIFENIDFTPYE